MVLVWFRGSSEKTMSGQFPSDEMSLIFLKFFTRLDIIHDFVIRKYT